MRRYVWARLSQSGAAVAAAEGGVKEEQEVEAADLPGVVLSVGETPRDDGAGAAQPRSMSRASDGGGGGGGGGGALEQGAKNELRMAASAGSLDALRVVGLEETRMRRELTNFVERLNKAMHEAW